MAGERDTFRSRDEEATVSAKAIAGQLGVEQGVHLLTKGALDEALKVAEASRVMPWSRRRSARVSFVPFVLLVFLAFDP